MPSDSYSPDVYAKEGPVEKLFAGLLKFVVFLIVLGLLTLILGGGLLLRLLLQALV
jgi:hypothetical protein